MSLEITVGDKTFKNLELACDHYQKDFSKAIKSIANGVSYDKYFLKPLGEEFSQIKFEHRYYFPDLFFKKSASVEVFDNSTEAVNQETHTETAADEKVDPRKEISTAKSITINHNGVKTTFESLTKLSKHYNVVRSTISRRLNNGYTPEQAVGLIPIESSNISQPRKINLFCGQEIKVNNKEKGVVEVYESITKASKHFGLPPSTVRSRIERNWSIEEALGLKERVMIEKKAS